MHASTPPQGTFEEVLHSHQAIVFKIVNTYCWRQEERADLAQEIAVQLWRAWPSYNPTRTFSTWMYRIALNVAISFVRKEVRQRPISIPLQQEIHDTPQIDGNDISRADRIDRLQQFIHRQPPLEKALLLLYLEDKSQREIAEILGITPTNVSTKISRLKQKIRSEL